MGFIRRQLLKVIEWKDNSNDTIVYRYPMTDRDEIMNGCQLVVNEGQMAILSKEGQFAETFGPGTHKLETKNLPILTAIASWKYGFDSPFKADVYYINTKQFINQTWGTSNPVMMRDNDFGMIRVRAFGKYTFQVNDAATLIKAVVGTNGIYTVHDLKDHLKTMFVTSFSDALATSKISALDIATKYEELSDALKEALQPSFNEMGLLVVKAYVENVSLPEEVEQAIDKRTSLGILSDKMGTYVAMETAQAMRDAANNPSGSGLAGAGVGLGAGVGMAGMMMNNLQNVKDEPVQKNDDKITCPFCQAQIDKDSKFCNVCGKQLPTDNFCSECGSKIAAGSNFCSNCGKKVN
ncbi:MAG: SPFH domain-containing protein [Bacilli bacterium]|nr:SPFH domain-containing protein [Bacilli bacterium]